MGRRNQSYRRREDNGRRLSCLNHTVHRGKARYGNLLTYDDIHMMTLIAKRKKPDAWRYVCEDGKHKERVVGLVKFKGVWSPVVYDKKADLIPTILPTNDVRIGGWNLDTGELVSGNARVEDPNNTPEFLTTWVQELLDARMITTAQVRKPRDTTDPNGTVSAAKRRFGLSYYLNHQNKKFRVDVCPEDEVQIDMLLSCADTLELLVETEAAPA